MSIYALLQYNTNHILLSADSRAIIGQMTADICHLSADGSLKKFHRTSGDNRPIDAR